MSGDGTSSLSSAVPERAQPAPQAQQRVAAERPSYSWWERPFARFAEWVTGWALERAVRASKARTGQRHKLRSIWGTTPILTLPLKADADRALGLESDSLVFTTYYITRSFTWNLSWLERLARRRRWLHLAVGRLILARVLARYDILHLFADRGFMPSDGRFGIHLEELDAIERSGASLYVYAYGADVRTRAKTLELGRWNFCTDCSDIGRHCVCDDARGAQNIERTRKAATALVSQGDMLAYMGGARHIAYWPIPDPHFDREASSPLSSGRPLRIAHAPNHTHFKGTRYLEQAIENLEARGFEIELVRVNGVPNERVLELFAGADLVADQFVGGMYGYTALEAMALGKPVLSYVRAPELVAGVSRCPIINCQPETLEAVLEWCCDRPDQLAAIGQQGRIYVKAEHSTRAVAARLAWLYRGTIDLPKAIDAEFAAFIAQDADRREALADVPGWRHPFSVADNVVQSANAR